MTLNTASGAQDISVLYNTQAKGEIQAATSNLRNKC